MTEKDKALLHIAVLMKMVSQVDEILVEIDRRHLSKDISTNARDKFIAEANVQRDALLFARDELKAKYGEPPHSRHGRIEDILGRTASER